MTPGSGQVMQFVTAPEKDSKKTVKDVASQKTEQAKQQARTKEQRDEGARRRPERTRHRLERYAQAQLPVHPQYIPAGTVDFAELEDPLDFGSETLPAEKANSIGGDLPEGSVVHARLLTALSSASATKGQEAEAVLARPLFDCDRLLYPQGSRLLGTVSQVQPARRLKKNGQLRIAFHQVVLPDGIEQKVEAALVGVQAGQDANLKLDSEGGAEVLESEVPLFHDYRFPRIGGHRRSRRSGCQGPQRVGHGKSRRAGGGWARRIQAGGIGDGSARAIARLRLHDGRVRSRPARFTRTSLPADTKWCSRKTPPWEWRLAHARWPRQA